jgi:hypothetical protein
VEKKSIKGVFHSQNGQNKTFSGAKIMQNASTRALALKHLIEKISV